MTSTWRPPHWTHSHSGTPWGWARHCHSKLSLTNRSVLLSMLTSLQRTTILHLRQSSRLEACIYLPLEIIFHAFIAAIVNVILSKCYRKDPSFSSSRKPQFSKWNSSKFILTKKKQPSVFFFKVR